MRHLRRVAPPLPYSIPIPVGVGILVAPPLVFVDFDDLLDSYGNAPLWATEFIEQAIKLGAFVEKSASGQGAHVFLRVTPDTVLKRNRYTRAHPSSPGRHRAVSKRAVRGADRHQGWQLEPQPELERPPRRRQAGAAFVAELDAKAAPILTPDLPPAPLTVPVPTQPVLDLLPALLTHTIRQAFDDPQAAYDIWQKKRHQSGADNSLSAWRFSLFLEASRVSSVSPLPVYELFNPQSKPAHPGIPDWQEFSGHNKKPHRRYADIQRAHALVVEELRLLALDLGEQPQPPPEAVPAEPLPPQDPTWAQLGLVMRQNKNGQTKPLGTSVNFIRVLSRHPMFSSNRIERNTMDGSTLFNRQPIQDTQVTRWLEPLRAVLDLPQDPPVEGVRAAVEVIADDNPYDPLAEFLGSLPKWRPAPDYQADTSLLSCWLEKVGATPSPDLKKFSRRILLGLVARALRPGVKFDYVPVFEGPQGVGKSTLVKTLVGANFYATLFGGLQSKDALMTLRGKWGVEISELAAFKKTDNESMKSFFSTDTDVFRPPYGRTMMSIPRRTVLFGTTNDAQYLTDHTGARRIWPMYFAKAIDIGWLRENRDALFAEAMYFFEQGEAFHDSLDEIHNEERQRALTKRLVTPAWQQKLPPAHPRAAGAARQRRPGHELLGRHQHAVRRQSPETLGPAAVRGPHDIIPARGVHQARRVGAARHRLSAYTRSAHQALRLGPPEPGAADARAAASLSRQLPRPVPRQDRSEAWLAQQAEHLEPALEIIRTSPAITALDFNTEGD
jgi:hypothetical protein